MNQLQHLDELEARIIQLEQTNAELQTSNFTLTSELDTTRRMLRAETENALKIQHLYVEALRDKATLRDELTETRDLAQNIRSNQ